jgi:murein DD-endopeptidase MepM/ murein hydrolase activator NlpD
MAKLTAEWAGRNLLFWRDSLDESMYQALLGIDLQEPAGTYNLALTMEVENENVSCSVPLTVRAGRFATERLQVAKKFVEPNPSDIARADRERRRLRELYATVTPERLWQGGFRLPLAGVRKGGNFGRRRILNGEPGSPHSGVDFPAAAGVPVHAAQRGRVVLADNLFFSGNTVLLDHGLGVYSLYGHFESVAVAEGAMVEAGAVLGHVGASGRVTGPHLHWGLVVNGAKVNPLEIIRVLGPSKETATNLGSRKSSGASKNKKTSRTR